ncbi:hypothetical protein HYV88_04940 [Candidatus Woesearchaeota archaeon]|nr:hypothetical protein [Candidatus Woesearchaeota archaeon]
MTSIIDVHGAHLSDFERFHLEYGEFEEAKELIESFGGEIVEAAFIINLLDLKGIDKLINSGYKTFSLIQFEGD